jgi:hypothetical protein
VSHSSSAQLLWTSYERSLCRTPLRSLNCSNTLRAVVWRRCLGTLRKFLWCRSNLRLQRDKYSAAYIMRFQCSYIVPKKCEFLKIVFWIWTKY